MALVVRPYAPSDLEACRELWCELTEHHREIYDDLAIGGEDPGRQFDSYVQQENHAASWVAVDGGTVVGLTGLLVDGKDAEVEPVVVSAARRGQGIGRKLVDHVIADARARGLRSLSIRPVARNARAIAHFHAAGFTLLGHLELFQSLDPESTRRWQDGPDIQIQGRPFKC